MNTVTVTFTHRQASFLAELLANGVSSFIFHDNPHGDTPADVLSAWRKENVLWKKNPFRGRGNDPRTRKTVLESEADRKFAELEARTLARIVAAMPAEDGGPDCGRAGA